MRPRSSTSGLPPLPLLALLPLPLTACLSKPGPPASCTDGRCLTVLAEEPGAGELVIDRDTAYWTINSLAGSIRACAVDNCAPHDLAPEQKAPHSLLVEGEDAIWASGSELYRVNRDRAPLQPVVQIDSNGVNPVHMFRHPLRYLYWSSDSGLWR